MQEGRAPERPAVVERGGPLRGVENQLHLAVFNGVDDVGPAFGDFVDLDGGNAVLDEVALRARGRQDPKTEAKEQSRRLENARLVVIPHRDEDRAAFWHPGAAAELAFGEGDQPAHPQHQHTILRTKVFGNYSKVKICLCRNFFWIRNPVFL